jgi:hypothetical protein
MLRIIIKSLVARNTKGISRGIGRSRILRKTRVLATKTTLSRRIILMTTLKLVRGVVVTITQLESATLLSI